jgi:glyoxylase-like metal-dependent hydrolase (beta-lactamase superfamily II)
MLLRIIASSDTISTHLKQIRINRKEMTMFKGVLPSLPVLLMLSFIVNFGPATPVKAQAPAGDSTGTLQFVANGEDLIRQGFTSKDGWNISFDEVLVNLGDIAAMQTSPPFEPGLDNNYIVTAVADLPGSYVVDLTAGDEDDAPILVGEVTAVTGRYNALTWNTVPATSGDLAGYAVLTKGTAEKEGETLEFAIGVETGYHNMCGEFVGDQRKGILQPGGTAEVEMTFHFDHIFGNSELPADDSLNELAPGFEPFTSVANKGVIETDLAALAEALPEDKYQLLRDILPTLGHTGEGHCDSQQLGALTFTANGEDFVRQGFRSKDGWDIAFDNVWVNLTGLTAYQTDPPYEPGQETGLNSEYEVSLAEDYIVDLAEGNENAAPIFVDVVPTRAGRYNALHWQMTPTTEGELAGNSVLLVGTAEKDGQRISFNIGLDESYSNTCGEFVGDERKGILQPGDTAEVEMTFHFDHIFGDAELPAGDSLNQLAPGFEPFASAAENGVLVVSLSNLAELLPEDEYQLLVDILPTLGHTGEGHCLYDEVGTLAFSANGEAFVRRGFLSDITAYQTNPPYDPDETGAAIEAEQVVQLPGTIVIDLAAGDDNARPIPVGKVIVPAGRYNALSWQMVPATTGEMGGYSLIMAGTAEKAGESLPVTIGVEESYSNLCGEYVGDTRKGILAANRAADLEMTFHFDHIFGDADLPPGDSLNKLSPGFEPFASVAEDGLIETDLANLADALPEDVFRLLVDILPTLGHTGESHCFYGEQDGYISKP